jgi:histidine ammonia-lyase
MSMGAGLKVEQSAALAARVIAIEIMCACQAIDLLAPLRTSARLQEAHGLVRARVPMLAGDRPPAPDIDAIAALILEGAFSKDDVS